jgi:hypothetical protein
MSVRLHTRGFRRYGVERFKKTPGIHDLGRDGRRYFAVATTNLKTGGELLSWPPLPKALGRHHEKALLARLIVVVRLCPEWM